MKKLVSSALCTLGLALCLFSTNAKAQEMHLGAQMGAIGSGDSSNIGYGGYLSFFPYDILGVMVDATFAQLGSSGGAKASYFSTSPSLVVYTWSTEEIKFGGIFGGGFYKFQNADMHFGLNFGVLGDFMVSQNMSLGMQVRYHSVFSSSDVWNVFLNVGFKFGSPSGGW